MNELHQAYIDMGVKPGASWKEIMKRYKTVVSFWHTDRAPDHLKADADEEMKKINNARDILKKHFQSGEHKNDPSCACMSGASTAGGGSGAGGGKPPGGGGTTGSGTQSDEDRARKEAEAKRRDAERREREEAERRRQEEEDRRRRAEEEGQRAVAQQQILEDEQLRWKIAKVIIAAFLGLELIGSIGVGLKDTWNHGGGSTITNTDNGGGGTTTTTDTGPVTSSQPPDIVRSHVDDLANRRASTWTTTVDSSGNGTVIGTDGAGRKIVDLSYGPGQNYQGHYVFSYYFDPVNTQQLTGVQIAKFEATGPGSPGNMGNRCVGTCNYQYDSNGRLSNATMHGNWNSLDSGVWITYDSAGNVQVIQETDSSGQNKRMESPTSQDIQGVKDLVAGFYFSSEFASDKLSNLAVAGNNNVVPPSDSTDNGLFHHPRYSDVLPSNGNLGGPGENKHSFFGDKGLPDQGGALDPATQPTSGNTSLQDTIERFKRRQAKRSIDEILNDKTGAP